MDTVDIGNSIRELRDLTGLSQQQLARRAHIAQSTLSYVESGKKSPTCDTLSAIAAGLDMTLLDLVRHAAKDIPEPRESALLERIRGEKNITSENLRQFAKVAKLLYAQYEEVAPAIEGDGEGEE